MTSGFAKRYGHLFEEKYTYNPVSNDYSYRISYKQPQNNMNHFQQIPSPRAEHEQLRFNLQRHAEQ